VRKEAYQVRSNKVSILLEQACLALGLIVVLGGGASAAEFSLKAKAGSMTLPGGETVPIWGFALGEGPPTVPGPRLTVPPGEGLTVHLTNLLPVPISFVIPGQKLPDNNAGPVWTDWPNDTVTWSGSRPEGNYSARVRSFTHEVPPGETRTYTWSTFEEGAFIYQTGTNPAAQVQMGLYGAVTKNFSASQAYGHPDTIFDKELVLVYSALDPKMNEAIASRRYGPGTSTPNTRDYVPKYFLINGKAWPDRYLAKVSGTTEIFVGDRVLIRLLNAGYHTFVPVFLNAYVTARAEDGQLYPFPRKQYALELAAGRSLDVWLVPSKSETITIYDGRLNLTNAGKPTPGGLYAKIPVIGPLTIYKTRYSQATKTLKVFARTKESPGTVVLTAVGFGDLAYRPSKRDYYGAFSPVPMKPDSVTVVSSAGASDTKPVPFTLR
jgi:FtsP/CotA-like multicopper oxidase with cupredoxin domain